MAFVVALAVWVVAIWTLFVLALVHVGRTPSAAFRAIGRSKLGTVLGLLLTGGVGSVYYFARIRGPVTKSAGELPPATPNAREGLSGWKSYRKGDDPWAGRA